MDKVISLVLAVTVFCCWSLAETATKTWNTETQFRAMSVTNLDVDSTPKVKLPNRNYGVESDTIFFASFDNEFNADYSKWGSASATTAGNTSLLNNGKFGKGITGFTANGDRLKFTAVGSNLLTGDDTTFAAGLGSWTAEAGTITNPSQQLSVSASSTASITVSGLTANIEYSFKIIQVADANSSPFILRITDTSNTTIQSTSYTSSNYGGTINNTITANTGSNTSVKIKIINSSATNAVVFDNATFNLVNNMSVFQGTMEMWVKRADWTTAADYSTYFVGSGPDCDFNVLWLVQSAGNATFISSSWGSYGTTNVDPNEWHYLAITWSTSANQKYIFIDGIQGSASDYVEASVNKNRPSQIDIGSKDNSYGSTVYPSNASFDSVRITNRAKSATEILQTLYERTGVIVSEIFDTKATAGITYNTLTYTSTIPSGSSITFEVRTGNKQNLSDASSWKTVPANGSLANVGKGRYIQWKATLTSDGSVQPSLSTVSLTYTLAGTIDYKTGGDIRALEDTETKITVPAELTDKEVIYTIKRDSNPSSGNRNQKILLAYEVSAKDSITNEDIKTFKKQFTITIHATSADGINIDNTDPKVKVDEADKKLVIGFWNGLYWVPISSKVTINDDKKDIYVIADTTHLSQYGIVIKEVSGEGIEVNVSPNPFTPLSNDSRFNRVNFTFENKDNEVVELKIWDLTARLVREISMSGVTTVSWDGRDEYGEVCEGGVYIYQLKVGNSIVKRGTVVLAR